MTGEEKQAAVVEVSPCVIGLTGGIASGKSTVCKLLGELGWPSVDADKLGHNAYAKGTACFDAVVAEFGAEIVGDNGEVNRGKLGPIVFGDKKKMKALTDIVWPTIRAKTRDAIQALADEGHKIVILEAAILLEAGWQSSVDQVWVVSVPKAIAMPRLMKRNNLSVEEAEKRFASQMSNEDRVKMADVVITNSGDLEALRGATTEAFEEFETTAKRITPSVETDDNIDAIADTATKDETKSPTKVDTASSLPTEPEEAIDNLKRTGATPQNPSKRSRI